MLRALIRKQMAEIFRSYFYDAKKNKARSRGATIGFIVMYVLLMVVVLGGMFTGLSVLLCGPFLSAGVGWMYFTLMGLLAVVLGAFGSVFTTYSGLYLAKDNDLLLSLPIPVHTVIAARLFTVYLMGLMYSAVVSVPAVIVYWIVGGFSAGTVIGGLLTVALISVFVLILSCLLGWVVAKISLKLKYKSFTTVLVSLLFIGGYYFLYFKASSFISTIIANAADYGAAIRGAAYPLYLFGRMGEGSIPAMLISAAVILVLFALTWWLLARSFLCIATASGKTAKARYTEKAAKTRSVSSALLGRELARFTGSPNYMLNCGLGTLFLLAGGVYFLIRGGRLGEVLTDVFGSADAACVLAATAVCMLASMNETTAPSVSLEGKNLWLIQSLPVTPRQALLAKAEVQLIVTCGPALLCALCIVAALRPGPMGALIVLLPLLYAFLSAFWGLFLNLKRPSLTWTSEIAPIKQSLPTALALFGSWADSILLAGGYFLLRRFLPAAAYLALFSAVTAVCAALLYRWVCTRGAKIFAAL